MIKERMDAGLITILVSPNKVFGKEGKYYTIFGQNNGDEDSEIYVVSTTGMFAATPKNNSEYCSITV